MAISIAYTDGLLHLLTEPNSVNGTPVHETLTIRLVSADSYQYRVLFLCEERHDDEWRFAKLQPMLISPSVTLVELDSILDAGLDSGMFCSGPSNP